MQSELERCCSETYEDLVAFARRRLGCRWDAEDVVQNALLRAWSRRGSIRIKSAIHGWLYAILKNEIKRHWSHRDHRERQLTEAESVADQRHCPDYRAELLDQLNLMERLPSIYQESLFPFAIEGRSSREIAQQLGITVNAVCCRNHRARTALAIIRQSTEEETG